MTTEKKYNHAFDIAFEVESDNDGEHVTESELIAGLLKRVANLINSPGEIIEACGLPFDTYTDDEFDEDDPPDHDNYCGGVMSVDEW